jgi:type I restriction enzyme S subunit
VSQFDELVQRLCPDGVVFRPLGELLDYEQPGKYLVTSTAYSDNHPTPVLTAGQSFILGYTDEMDGIYPACPESAVVIFDDFTTAFKWVDFPFKAKSSAMKMLTPKSLELASLRYIYYAMQTIHYAPQDHARQWIGTYSQFRIPVPPLEVQRKIVRILDQFTQLNSELEAELKARRRQHAFYWASLLTPRNGWSTTSIGEVAEVFDGPHATPKKTQTGPWYLSISSLKNGRFDLTESAHLGEDEFPKWTRRVAPRPGDTMFSYETRIGQAAFWDRNEPAALGRRMGLLRPRKSVIDPRFLSLVYLGPQFQALIRTKTVSGSTVDRIPIADMASWPLVIPPLDEQKRIVESLDKFDALVNDHSIGLPAELAARRKQFEYYRDKLLTFEEATS